MKTCKRCELNLPMDCYRKHPQTSDGHVGICKVCSRGHYKPKEKSAYQKILEKNPLQDEGPTPHGKNLFTPEDREKIRKLKGKMTIHERDLLKDKYEKETGVDVDKIRRDERFVQWFSHAGYKKDRGVRPKPKRK